MWGFARLLRVRVLAVTNSRMLVHLRCTHQEEYSALRKDFMHKGDVRARGGALARLDAAPRVVS